MSDLKSLKEFKVGGLNIHLTSFNRLYKVETLEAISITSSTIQGKLPDGISSLTKLKNLNLGGTRITSLPSDMLCLCCVGISLLPAGRDREGISRRQAFPRVRGSL